MPYCTLPAPAAPAARVASYHLLRQACAWAGWSALALAASSVQAQTPTAATLPVLEHRIRMGDTLEQLALRYLGDASLWQQLQAHNQGVDPLRLPPGNVLQIPLNLLRSASANVDFVQGNASLSRRGDSSAGAQRPQRTQPLQAGQRLQEGDRLELAPDAFVTVRLADGSSVRIQANSEVTLRQLRRRGRAGSLQSVLQLQQGGLEVDVPAQRRQTQRTLDVLTPVAATSVRGTRFEVHASAQSTTTAVERGQVQMRAAQHAQRTGQLLASGYGMAVHADGQQGKPTPLLPAPALQDLPQLNEDAQWLNLPLPSVPGASAYRVQVMADRDGTQVLRNATVNTPQARFAAVADGQYWLQVRAVDAQGIAGHKANAPLRVKAHPVAPLPQTPAPNAISAAGATQLQCTPVHEAQAYVLQIAPLAEGQTPTQASFAQPLLQAHDSRDCKLDVSALPAGRYAWRTASVRWMEGARDQGPWLKPLALTLATPPKTLSSDDVQAQQHYGISTLYWPSEPGQRYRLQALASAQDSTPAVDLWLDTAQWQASGLPSGAWQVRIQVQDTNGLLSAFSPMRQVQVLPLVSDGSGQVIGTAFGLGLERMD